MVWDAQASQTPSISLVCELQISQTALAWVYNLTACAVQSRLFSDFGEIRYGSSLAGLSGEAFRFAVKGFERVWHAFIHTFVCNPAFGRPARNDKGACLRPLSQNTKKLKTQLNLLKK